MIEDKKKLLILGATSSEISIVERIQQMGMYAVVTDYHTDWRNSPAKYVANEAWNISWSDIPLLKNKCIECGIIAVIAGYSEFRVSSMIDLCEVLHLPCYINREQLEVTRDKLKFKNLCRQFNIPAIHDYGPEDEIVYPVIIKPSDRAGGIGINVAYNAEEYARFLDEALSLSPTKSVIVEDFIHDGIKFDTAYYIEHGKSHLIETCDTVMLRKEKGTEKVQNAWTYPSKYEKEYIEKVDTAVRQMLDNFDMTCGVANLSFFYTNGSFYIFEAGFRLGGDYSFDYQRASGGVDYLDKLLEYAITGQCPETVVDIPDDRGFALTYIVYVESSSSGEIEEIQGLDTIRKQTGLITFVQKKLKGDAVEKGNPFVTLICTWHATSVNQIIDNVNEVNRVVRVRVNGTDFGVWCKLTEKDILERFN